MPNPISVVWVEQIEAFYCGAAAGAMILNGVGIAKPFGPKARRDWQKKLWETMTAITTGPARPEEAMNCDGFLPEFEKQQCHFCSGEWLCWAATPQALRDAMNEYLPASGAMRISRSTNRVTVTAKVMKSIDAQCPAALAAGAASHWVVVRGYLAGDADLDSQRVGGKDLNGLYVLDPNVDPSDLDGLDFVPTDAFLDGLVLVVKCGSAADQGKKLVIVKKPVRR